MQMFLQYTNQWDNLATEVHVVYSLHGCIKCEKCVSYKKIMLLITFEGGWKWEVRKKLMLWKYIIEKNYEDRGKLYHISVILNLY